MVYCSTEWGQWGQTIDEVYIEMDVAEGTRSRDIRCEIKPKTISVVVNRQEIIKVNFIAFTFFSLTSHCYCKHSLQVKARAQIGKT